ncbi:MAG: hypothetical protein Q8835_03450 [Sweet potato little leaf phytoplasma]|nr:hypothetical protein [Sweet potato little leaf phytoplasma]
MIDPIIKNLGFNSFNNLIQIKKLNHTYRMNNITIILLTMDVSCFMQY